MKRRNAIEWICDRCGIRYTSPLPVLSVSCSCSKRAGGREQRMRPVGDDE